MCSFVTHRIVHLHAFAILNSRGFLLKLRIRFSVTLLEVLLVSCTELQMVSRNAILASGLVAFATAGLLFPVVLSKSQSKPIIDSSKPLSPGAIMRGPYINAGSRDIGPDPAPRKLN